MPESVTAPHAHAPLQGRTEALLPQPRGPLSAVVLDALRAPPPGPAALRRLRVDDRAAFGDDLQLALHVCYELHYQGFSGVDAVWEWDAELLGLRGRMEQVFLAGLRAATAGGDDVAGEVDALLVEPVGGAGLSRHLCEHGEWWQMRESFVHRSIYQLKEADPQMWVVPRLRGRAKAALVAVEYDEYGGGRAERLHAQLYADLLAGAGLDPRYLHYLDHVPAPSLAIVNAMSLFGLHRALRGALVGHFSAGEITTASSARLMVQALQRMGADDACVHFYREHVEADAVHEQVMRRGVVGGLLEAEPELAGDVVLGIQVAAVLGNRLSDHLTRAWEAGRSSLRRPLPA